MNVQIQSVKFDADKRLVEFVENKMDKLDRFAERSTGAEVILRLDKDFATDTSVMHWTKLLHENGAVFVISVRSLFCTGKMLYYRLLMWGYIPQMSDGCGKNRSVNEIKGSI